MPRKKKRPRAEDAPGAASSDASPLNSVGGPGGFRGGKDDIRINAAFAERYDAQKRRELLASVPAAALEGDGSSSSDDEEEDEMGELLTKKVDRRIRDTLQALREKDPRIYDKSTCFFEDDEKKGANEEATGEGDRKSVDDDDSDDSDDVSSDDEPVAGWEAVARAAEEGASGKVTLKDYVRETLLRDGRLSDSEEEVAPNPRSQRRVSFADEHLDGTHSRADFKRDGGFGDGASADDEEEEDEDGVHQNDGNIKVEEGRSSSEEGGESDDDGDFFTKKEKTKEEEEEEEADFEDFLNKQARKKGVASKPGDELLLHSYLEKDSPDEKERFLRDFVLNNGWLERGNGAAPAAGDYKIEVDNTIVKSADGGVDSEDDVDPDADSDFEDQVDAFEHKYNFRFEEPDGAKVVSHARTIEGSLRRPDDRRKKAREARKKRKEHEKLVKTEEIKHLKNLKKREIEARLAALQDAAGDDVDFSGIDLDADFDPDEFSKQMESRFGDEYYEDAENDAPVLEKQLEAIRHGGDDDVDDEVGEDTGEAMSSDVKRLVDEYYNLDYEDIIGGTPVRFKYKKVDQDSFNMDADEILFSDDKDLNRKVSLKYLATYRSKKSIPKRVWRHHGESGGKKRKRSSEVESQSGDQREGSHKRDKKRKKKKAKSEDLQDFESGGTVKKEGEHTSHEDKPPVKEEPVVKEEDTIHTNHDDSPAEEEKQKKKKKKKKKKKSRKDRENEAVSSLSSSRRAAYGL